MSISITSFTTTQTESARPARRPPPPGGASERPSHAEAIETLGSGLGEDVQEAMLETVAQMQEDGATFDDIKAYVDDALDTHGVSRERPGQLLNTTA